MAARGIFILFITIVFFLDKDAFLLYGAKHGELKFQPFRQFSLISRKFENDYCITVCEGNTLFVNKCNHENVWNNSLFTLSCKFCGSLDKNNITERGIKVLFWLMLFK